MLSADAGTDGRRALILQARTPAPTLSRIDAAPAPRLRPKPWPTRRRHARYQQRLRLRRRRYGDAEHRGAVPNPGQADLLYRAPARFVRIEKAVEIPDKTVRKINNSAFGPAGMGMREILGYAPVATGRLGADPSAGQRAFHHRRRSTRTRGASRRSTPAGCSSCRARPRPATAATPTAQARPSHGRAGLTDLGESGRAGHGLAVPEHQSGARAANAGETMAQTLALEHLHATATPRRHHACSQISSADVIYADVWTDRHHAAARRMPPSPICYADLTARRHAADQSRNCATWTAQCRSHHPLSAARSGAAASCRSCGVASRTTTGRRRRMTDHTCSLCHNPVNAMAIGASARRAARSDRHRLERRYHGRRPLMSNCCLHIMSRRLIWACLQDLLVPAPDRRIR